MTSENFLHFSHSNVSIRRLFLWSRRTSSLLTIIKFWSWPVRMASFVLVDHGQLTQPSPKSRSKKPTEPVTPQGEAAKEAILHLSPNGKPTWGPYPLQPFGSTRAPFVIFQGKDYKILTADGKKYSVKKNEDQLRQYYLITLNGGDDYEIAKKPRGRRPKQQATPTDPSAGPSQIEPLLPIGKVEPDVVTLDSNTDESDVEIVNVVSGQSVKQTPVKPSSIVSNAHGKMEIKRVQTGRRSNAKDVAPRKQVFDVDNLSYLEETEYVWYIKYVNGVVMDKCYQAELWRSLIRYQVLPTDLPLSAFSDIEMPENLDLIELCCVIRRAFLTFLRRASAVYKFVFPQVVAAHMNEILIQIWVGLTTPEKEMFYYSKSCFNVEMIDVVVKHPPGIFERTIYEKAFPGGVEAEKIPTYDEAFGPIFAAKEIEEQRRQAEDWEAFNRSQHFPYIFGGGPSH